MPPKTAGRHTPHSPKWKRKSSSLLAMVVLSGLTGLAYWSVAPHLPDCKCEGDERKSRDILAATRTDTCPTLSVSEKGKEEPLLSLTIFCAPKPFEPGGGGPQLQALLSWLRLDPAVKVVLIGNSSLDEVAAKFPGRVVVESDVDFNFRGTPMFHSLIARAKAADTRFSLFINADILLLGDFLSALRKIADRFQSFVLTAMRWDVDSMPYYFEEGSRKLMTENKTEAHEDDVRTYVREHGSLHTYGGVDFWAWNNGPVPLHEVAMPPFTFGRGRYDNWFTHEMVESNFRAIVDASDAVTSIHLAHSYSHLISQGSPGGNFWTINKKRNWEAFSNIFLSRTAGSFSSQMGTAMHIPWKLASCDEPASGNMCLARRVKPFSCRCEYSPYVLHTQSEPTQVGKKLHCGNIVIDNDIEIPTLPTRIPVLGLPHTLDQLLQQVGDADRTVILVAATSRYRELVVDFACRLAAMNITNLIVAAMDEDLYLYAFTQGLPVYYDVGPASSSQESSPLTAKEAAADCARGAHCFHQYREVKFNAILQALKRNYTVLWSDVDMLWVRSPLPHLRSLGQGDLWVQSSVPDPAVAANGAPPRGTDMGGIMYARPTPRVIELFADAATILAKGGWALRHRKGSFLHPLLCGEKGKRRASTADKCTYKNGVAVVFLRREEYPMGSTGNIWRSPDVVQECLRRGCFVVHNNLHDVGPPKKIRRLEDARLWLFDAENRMCLHRRWGQASTSPP